MSEDAKPGNQAPGAASGAAQDAAPELAEAAALLAHELRTPLTAVLANAEMLAAEPAVAADEELRTMAEGVVRAALRMNDLIGTRLDPLAGRSAP